MAGIPSHLLISLRKGLADCEQFETNRSLRNVFADERLTPWRDSLPQADGIAERVDSAIGYLHDKKHRDGSNALISLLLALAEGMDEGDDRREKLFSLANQLVPSVPRTAPPLPVDTGPSGPPASGGKPDAASPPAKRDFFISYNRHDKDWAEWIAWQLEDAGYTTYLQAWDFRPGGNFVSDMHRASAESERTIAVLSRTYLTSEFAQSEWTAAFARDPAGKKGILLPVKVRKCDLEGLLPQIVYIDLIGVPAPEAAERLLAGIKQGRAKPLAPPNFPDAVTRAEPPLPGGS
jgi:hypothetical protein